MKIDWDEDDAERDQKRSKLIESAAQLFHEKGFKKTKIDEIAASTQRSKTALYYYFKNKKSIFSAVVEWELSKIYQEVELYTLDNITLEDFIQGAAKADFHCIDALLRYVEKTVEIGDNFLRKQKNILGEYTSFQKLIQSIIKAFKEQNVILLRALLEYGQQQGQLALEETDIPLAAYAIFRICLTYYSDIMQGIDFSIDKEDLQSIILLMVRKAAGTAED